MDICYYFCLCWISSALVSVVSAQTCQYGESYRNQCECWRGYKGPQCDVYDKFIMTSLNSGVGMNLEGITYYSTQWTFVDIMHTSMWWVTQRSSGPDAGVWNTEEHHLIPWRQDGYPEYLPEENMRIVTLLLRDSQVAGPNGTYTVLYEGLGEITFGFLATEISRSPGRIEISVNLTGTSGIQMQISNITASNPIRNIRIIMPGFEDRYEVFPFHPLFIDFLKSYSVLRFMDWGLTNNYPENITWSDRRLTEFYTQAGGPERRGVAYEHMIHLANIAGSSPWICIPHAADDEYVRNLAIMIRDSLRPDLRIYVEYSNEVWNSQFTQHEYAGRKGIELGFTDPDTPWEGAWRYTAHRSIQIFDIFKEQFGENQRARLEFILPTQKANPYVTEQIVSFQDAYQHADSIAMTAYFCGYLGNADNRDWVRSFTVDQLFDNCTNSFASEQQTFQAQVDVAATYNLSLTTYEASQHIVVVGAPDEEITEKFIEMNRVPRMEEVHSDWMSMYEATVTQNEINAGNAGGMWFHFLSISEPNQYGSWGMVEALLQDPYEAPKYLSVQKYNYKYLTVTEGPRCSFVQDSVTGLSYGCFRGNQESYACYQSSNNGNDWQSLPVVPGSYKYLVMEGLNTADNTLYIRSVNDFGVSYYFTLSNGAFSWIMHEGQIHYSEMFGSNATVMSFPPGYYGNIVVDDLSCP